MVYGDFPCFRGSSGSLLPLIFHFNSNLTRQHLERRLEKNLGVYKRPCACEFYMVTLAWPSLQFISGNSASMNRAQTSLLIHCPGWVHVWLISLGRAASPYIPDYVAALATSVPLWFEKIFNLWFTMVFLFFFSLFPAMCVLDWWS